MCIDEINEFDDCTKNISSNEVKASQRELAARSATKAPPPRDRADGATGNSARNAVHVPGPLFAVPQTVCLSVLR